MKVGILPVVLLLVVQLVACSSSYAVNRYWISGTPGVWSNAANWSGATVPGASDNVFFDGGGVGNCLIDVPVNVLNLSILAAYSGIITQQDPNTITLNRTDGTPANGLFQMTGGTFVGGSAAINIRRLDIQAGSFTSTSGVLSIGGSGYANIYTDPVLGKVFSQTGGVFAHNNGSVYLDPSNISATPTYEINTIGSTSFFDLTLAISANSTYWVKITPSTGDVIEVLHQLTLTDGFVLGAFSLKGSLIENATFDGVRPGDVFTLTINGSTDQTYSIQNGAGRLGNLIINKPGVMAPLAGTSNLSIAKFDLQQGSFTAPPGNFNIGGDFSSIYANTVVFSQAASTTFTHNYGTVAIDPFNVGATINLTLDVANGSTLFYNLTSNPQGSSIAKLETATGDVVDVLNNLTLNDGYARGNFSLKGNLVVGSGFDGVRSADAGGTGTFVITLNGAGNQEYGFQNGSGRLGEIVINKGTGTVTPASGTTTLNLYYFTLSQGNFTAPTGVFSIGGDYGNIGSNKNIFVQANGTTFTHQSGSIRFDPSNPGGSISFTIDVIPTTQFYNVEFNGPNGRPFSIDVNDKIICLNNLVLTDAIVNTTTLEVQGNVTVGPVFDGGSASLLFSGANAQVFDLTGGIGNYNGNIAINKSSNNVTLNSPLMVDAPSQSITFTKGNMITSAANLLSFGDNTTWSSASINSFIDGPVSKIGNDAFTFPVGDGGYFGRLSMSAPAVITDAFTCEYLHVNPNVAVGTTKANPLDHISFQEYWALQRSSGTSNVSVTLSWDNPDRSGLVTLLNDLVVAAWNTTQWENIGQLGTTGNLTSGTITNGMVPAAYNLFTLASLSTQNPLPIELIGFEGHQTVDGILLEWTCLSELNNDYFEILRSSDGKEFKVIGKKDGASTTSAKTTYTFLDADFTTSILYYQLRQTDLDGSVSYSSVIKVEAPWSSGAELSAIVFPNPARDQFRFKLRHPFPEPLQLQIVSDAGLESCFLDIPESRELVIDCSTWKDGVYSGAVIRQGVKVASVKFLVIH